MKSEWQSWIQLIVILLNWFSVSSRFERFRRRIPPLVSMRSMRPPKYYYLLVKAIPRMHLPDYDFYYENPGYRDFMSHGDNSDLVPIVSDPVLEEVAAWLNEEEIIDHYTITHHITRVRKRSNIYSNFLRHPFGYRLKREPTRKYRLLILARNSKLWNEID